MGTHSINKTEDKSMKKEQAKAEICKARKSAGLSCNGCQYGDDCEEKKQKETVDGIPADIKPGTKQAKIYGLLKSGKTTKEIIQSKEFASESVYIVARRYFPDSLDKTKSKPRKKEQLETPENPNMVAKPIEETTMQAIKEYLAEDEEPEKTAEPAPEIDERILEMERIIKEEKNRGVQRGQAMGELRYAIRMLEDGEIVKCYAAIKKALELMEGERWA